VHAFFLKTAFGVDTHSIIKTTVRYREKNVSKQKKGKGVARWHSSILLCCYSALLCVGMLCIYFTQLKPKRSFSVHFTTVYFHFICFHYIYASLCPTFVRCLVFQINIIVFLKLIQPSIMYVGLKMEKSCIK
jgi:hypothetical protein